MTEFFKKNRKKLIFVTFLFLLFFGGWWNLKYNLPKTIEVIVKIALGPTFKSSSINFEKEKIVIKDFVLADGDEIIIDTPEVDILYSKKSLKKFRIEEIIINGGTANITRRKNGDINIVAAFTGGTKESNDEKVEAEVKQEEKYEPGIGIPIDKITGKNVTTVFRDLGYRLPIEQTAYNTNGYLTFSKTEGIDLHFIGNNKEEIYDFAFSTAKEPYSMTIKLSNIGVKNELAQYGYDGKEVSYEGGKLNMDLTIASSGMLGWIAFDGVNVKYIDLDDTVKNIVGKVDFNDKGIFLNAQGDVFGNPEKFYLTYKDNELNIDFNIKNIKKKDIEKLSYLKGIDLPFESLNIDSVKFNLNMKKELKITIDAFLKSLEIRQVNLSNTELKLIYDSTGIHLPISTTLNSLDEKKNIVLQEKIDGNLNFLDKKGDLAFNVKNINQKNYIPNLEGNLDFDILENEILLKLNSNIINLEGKYLLEEKKVLLNKENEYFLEYDIANNKLVDGKGKLSIFLYDFEILLDYKAKNNELFLNNFVLLENKKELLNLVGGINLNKFSYAFDIKSKDLDIKRKIEKTDLELKGKFLGKVAGEKGNFEGDIDISELSVKYLGEIEKLAGKIEFNNKKDFYLKYEGEINKLSYENYSLSGIAISTRIKDNKFEIRNFNNQLLSLVGEYDLKNQNIKGKSEIRELFLDNYGVDFPKVKLNNLDMEVNGNLDNLKGKLSINDIGISFGNDEEIKINGILNYENGTLKTTDLKINNSILKGEYNLKTQKYSGKLNIFEENIGRYYNNEKLKYRVIGNLKVEGTGKNIDTSLNGTVDKIYMSGTILPTLYFDIGYKAKELIDGNVEIKEVTLNNSDLQELLKITGYYKLQDNFLDVRILKQELDLLKIKKYISMDDIKGKLIIEGDLKGKVDDLTYNLSIGTDVLTIKDIDFNNLKFIVLGDLKKVKLKEFSFNYLGNTFYSRGNYDLVNNDYLYLANSKEINLKFLNAFLEKYGITNIEGEAAFNLKLNDKRNKGFLKVKNLNLENKDLFLKLKEFNSTILLEDNQISIKRFKGKLNDGILDVNGEVLFPTMKEISENPYYYEQIKYGGNLKLANIQYKYGDYFNVDFNADISIKDKKVDGLLEIKKGQVSEIPNTSKSIFQKIKEFLFSSSSNTINQSEELGSDFKIENIIENAPVIDLRLKIDEGIKLDIASLNSFVGDIKGTVIGNGVLSGKDGKYTFIGNTELLGGSLNINDNTFYLERALVIFNDQKTYLPKVNPNLLIDSRLEIDDDQIKLSLNGELDNLKFTISSKNGSSSGNLNSLLTNEENLGENNEATTTLITNVIGGQLTQILRPVSNLVKNTLNISKFRIRSNLLTEETKDPNNEGTKSSLKLGAVLEAEDNIYKDKIWWVAKGTLLEEDSTEENKRSNSSGAFKEYDFSLEYRFDTTKSIGIGVGKLPEERKTISDKDSKENLNYHIDFKFEKKYDKLIDIFINN